MAIIIKVEETVDADGIDAIVKEHSVRLSHSAERYLTGCRAYNPEEQDLAVWVNEILEGCNEP